MREAGWTRPDEDARTEGDIGRHIAAVGFSIMSNRISMNNGHGCRLGFKLCYVPAGTVPLPPPLLTVLAQADASGGRDRAAIPSQ
jgi:hypothetical protein